MNKKRQILVTELVNKNASPNDWRNTRQVISVQGDDIITPVVDHFGCDSFQWTMLPVAGVGEACLTRNGKETYVLVREV